MERVIVLLREELQKQKTEFIDNSIIVYNTKGESPIPCTEPNLEMIIQLNKALIILQNIDKVTINWLDKQYFK